MSLRFTFVSLVLAVAACGGDEGGSGDPVDGGNRDSGNGVDSQPADAYVPPTENCDPLDLANAPEVPIVNAAVTPNPQAGTIVAGTYKLTSAKLFALGGAIQVNGTAQARVEIVVGNATAGAARLAVVLQGTALNMPFDQDLTGAGLYSIAGSDMTVAQGCGASEALPVLHYTATPTTLMLWADYNYNNIEIPIELGLALE